MALKNTRLVFKTLKGTTKLEALKSFEEFSNDPVKWKESGWENSYDKNSDYIIHWEDDSDEDVDIEMWFIYKLIN